MAMVKSFTNGSLAIPINDDAMIICPVLDTGKNSVSPSIIARTMASKEFIYFLMSGEKARLVVNDYSQPIVRGFFKKSNTDSLTKIMLLLI